MIAEEIQPKPDLIAGVVLEANDLAATRRFYDLIFRDAGGTWAEGPDRLRYRCGPQTIEFVRRQRPRTYAVVGQHQAYRVRPNQLGTTVGQLEAAGHKPNWWREDHPFERRPTAYLDDPSGNRVQLVGSDDDSLLLRHAAIVVYDMEQAELFYTRGLGGEVDYAHGFKSEDEWGADDWGRKRNDPCAPWTRRAIESYRTHTIGYHPTAQLFLRFGPTILGLVLAGRHVQSPPEEAVRGAPRVILRTPQPAAAVERYLDDAELSSVPLLVKRRVPMKRVGRNVYLRDFGGVNFVQLACKG